MSEETEIREGTTASVDMQLLNNGSSIDLTGIDHVTLCMMDAKGQVYRYASSDTSTYATVVTASSGTVRFSPPSTTTFRYNVQPYTFYWWVYPTAATRYSVPTKGIAVFNIIKDY